MMDQRRRDGTREGREATFGSQQHSAICTLTGLPPLQLFCPRSEPQVPDDTLPLIRLLSYKKVFCLFCHFSLQFKHLSFLHFAFVCIHRPTWVYL